MWAAIWMHTCRPRLYTLICARQTAVSLQMIFSVQHDQEEIPIDKTTDEKYSKSGSRARNSAPSQEKGKNYPQFRNTERAWPDSWAKEYFVAPAFSLLNETNGIFKVKISSWEIIDGKDSSPFHLPHPIKTFLSLCMMFGERQIT